MVENIWVSETPVRDEVSLLLDMDPDRPIHCDWCGLFVTYQIPFDDDVPVFCARCEPEWTEEMDEVKWRNANGKFHDEGPGALPPSLFFAVFEDTIVADDEGCHTPICRGDLDTLRERLVSQSGVATLDGQQFTEADVERIETLFTNMDLGTAPLRCPFCRAVKPCANHDERN